MHARGILAAMVLALPIVAGCPPPCPTVVPGDDAVGAGSEAPGAPLLRDLAMGVGWRCVCLESGNVRCWRPSPGAESEPATVPFVGINSCSAVAIDGADLCVVDRGAVVCAELPAAPDGAPTADEAIHATEPFIEGLPGDALGVDVRYGAAFVIVDGHGLWRARIRDRLEPPERIFGFDDPVGVATGGLSVCTVERDGSALCSGANARGQLGDAGTIDAPFAVPVAGVHHVRAIGIGMTHGCAVVEPAEVVCWGELTASLGRGYGPSDSSSEPDPSRAVTMAPTAVHLDARDVAVGDFTCALSENGDVSCWGALEIETAGVRFWPTYTPQLVGTFSGARWVGVSGDGVCAWSSSALMCWRVATGRHAGHEATPRFESDGAAPPAR